MISLADSNGEIKIERGRNAKPFKGFKVDDEIA